MFPFFLIPGYKNIRPMFPLSFRLVLTSYYTVTFALIVQITRPFFYPTCFNPKSPFYYSFLLPLFFKLLLYRCPLHTVTPSEYLFHGHRSLI
jgi:hypothetical protein